MKVLVLGGTGAIGSSLVQILTNKGIETYVTSRKYRDSSGKVHYIQGNAHDLEFIRSLLQEKWDAIVDFMIYTTPDFYNRVDLLLSSTSQYVFISSARVYADSDELITEKSTRLLDVSEDKKYLSTDDYALRKAIQEDILKQTGSFNWTIIRPYITYNDKRLQLGIFEKEIWLYRALQRKTIVFPKNLCNKFTTLTYGPNVANGIAEIINNPNTLGEIFNITTCKYITWQNVLNIYISALEDYLGEKPKIKLLDFNDIIQCKIDRYQFIYDRLYNRKFDNTQIGHFIDTKSFITPEEGLKISINEFLQNPNFNDINYIVMGAMDKKTGEKVQFASIPTLKEKLNYAVCRFFPDGLISYGLKIVSIIFS